MRLNQKVITTTLLTALSAGTAGQVMAQDPFSALPFGSVKPKGWIELQMQQDIDQGFVGKLDKLVPDLIYQDDIYGKDRLTKLVKRKDVGTANSGHEWEVQFLWWNSETQSNWWDGYLRNIMLLDHPVYSKKVEDYVNAKLATADADGYIGIYAEDLRYNHSTENGELWAQSSLFRGLLAYYESTGRQDVLDAVIKAVDVTMNAYPIGKSTPFKATDAFAGVGHGLTFVDVLNTLYRITGETKYLDFAVFLFDDYSAHPQPEEDVQLANIFDEDYRLKGHGVHSYEHLRALTIAAYHSDDKKYAKALEVYLGKIDELITASGGAIGDEWIGGRHAHHSDTGYEYCSLQELLHAYAVLLQKTGDSKWADKIEWLIYNAAQGARHPDGQSMAYCQTDNSYEVLGHIDMDNPQGEMRFKYSPAHQDVAVCCAPNAGRIYPYFTQNIWQANEQGVVANLYGPSVMTTKIDGVDVTIEQVTQYPFEHQVTFKVSVAKPVEFALTMRNPSWANKADIKGAQFTQNEHHLQVSQTWQGESEFTLSFDDTPQVSAHTQGTVGVEYGPLLYALELGHQAQTIKTYDEKPFKDLLFKGTDKGKEQLQMPKAAKFELIKDAGVLNWQNSPKLSGKLYDPKAKQLVDAELVPMGNTVLRKVSFEQAK